MIGFYLTSCFAVMTMVEPSTLTSSSSGLKRNRSTDIFFSHSHLFSLVVLCIKGDLEFVIVVGHLEIYKPIHLCINMSSHALKGFSPNLWMWKPIRVLGLLRLLEDSSVAPVALLFHLVEGLVSNKWITRSLLVEVVVVNNKIFALMSC